MTTVWSVGHGARPLEEFLATIRSASIELLIDVRMFPGSRRHPHFSRESLDLALSEAGIRYEWWGETLGGRRKAVEKTRHPAWRNDSFRAYADHMDTEDFRGSLRRVQELARAGTRLAVMCSETLWWRCHRRLISDALTVDGFEVVHLISPREQQGHRLHGSLRVDEDGRPVYDVGVEVELPFTPDP
jgi:uncharacterized protein (DUF488 family)